MSDKYRRDGTPYPEGDGGLFEWAADIENPNTQRVAETTLPNGKWVSTVWLGLNSQFGNGPPLIFETMVFTSKNEFQEEDCERYTTEAEAIEGHRRMVEKWRAEKMSATPRPWVLRKGGQWAQKTIDGAVINHDIPPSVVRLGNDSEGRRTVSFVASCEMAGRDEENQANAALIVSAVNSHDAALELAGAVLADLPSVFTRTSGSKIIRKLIEKASKFKALAGGR